MRKPINRNNNIGAFIVGTGLGLILMFLLFKFGFVHMEWNPTPLVIFWFIVLLAWLVGPLTQSVNEPEVREESYAKANRQRQSDRFSEAIKEMKPGTGENKDW
jgi:hypothetical protein